MCDRLWAEDADIGQTHSSVRGRWFGKLTRRRVTRLGYGTQVVNRPAQIAIAGDTCGL